MSIPASNIVNVTPRVINAGGTDLEFAGLFITENPLCTFPGAMSFTSLDAVGEYFGEASEEYTAAQHYFLGYDDSFKKPRTVWFARSANQALSGALIGGTAGNMTALKAITNGTLTLSIDSTEVNLSELNFSSANSQSDVAQTIQQGITTASSSATVAFDSQTGGFIITSSSSGATSAVTVATGDAAATLGLSASAGAVTSAGSPQLTPAEQMAEIVNDTTDWATFTTIYMPEAEEMLGYCAWANGQDVDYLYVAWTNDPADAVTTNTENLPNQIIATQPEGVTMVYGDYTYAAFIMGIAGSIDWNRNNGLITFKFRSQDGLVPTVTDETTAAALTSMNVNYYGRYATRADEFTILAEGQMMGGDYDYIDAYLGMVWLKNNIQLSCMTGFTGVGRVPYNDAGYTIIRAWCADTIERAKLNGVIQSGVVLSQSQKAQLINEIGTDVSSQLYTNGYYLQVADPGAQARQNRESPTIGLWFTYGGAVHKLDIPVTLIK